MSAYTGPGTPSVYTDDGSGTIGGALVENPASLLAGWGVGRPAHACADNSPTNAAIPAQTTITCAICIAWEAMRAAIGATKAS